MSPRLWGPEYEEEDEEYDDDDSYEDESPRYMRRVHRHRSRPRQQVRHVSGRDEREFRPRSRSRPRGQIPVEMISADHRPRHRHRSRSRHHRHARRSKSRHRGPPQPSPPQRSAELQAQIDALTVRLNNIMDDSYARDIIAKENITFDILFKEQGGGPPAEA
ncbi:hypothetical protein BDD12DRAFT_836932 [Trichophaea hybrida]|nr:hypothetical protein BDD12DRAFT_836932 [Trichophaea hybrida]